VNINMTLIGQTIAFAIFVWFCIKYVWPPISNALHERQKRIADGLDAASRASRDLEMAQEQANQTLRESKEQASQLLEQANTRSAHIVEDAREQARAEGERMITGARSAIEQDMQRAREELRAQVAHLAVLGAERVLEGAVDEKAHRKLLDELAAEL